MTEVRTASLSDQGRHRELNEDSVLDDLPLVAVADGMGGHVAGEVASGMAVELLAEWKSKLESAGAAEIPASLHEAFVEINSSVLEKGQSSSKLTGMGTTLTAAWIQGDRAYFAHVGDSRAYLLRDGVVRQLTEDQTKAQEFFKRGEAATSRDHHILVSVIGIEPELLTVSTFSVGLQGGDRLVLASDGWSDMVPDNERMAEILQAHPDSAEACRAMVEEANEAGGHDNVSVVLIDVLGDRPAQSAPIVTDDHTPDHAGMTSEFLPVDQSDGEDAPDGDDEPPAKSKWRSPRRLLVIGMLAVVAIAAAAIFLPSDPSYVLASRGGSVVILDGKIGRGGEPATGRVVRVLDEPRIHDLSVPARNTLHAGVEVESMEEALRLLSGLPRVLRPDQPLQETPAPTPDGMIGASPEPIEPEDLP
jgi:PPM family protein phosphatase